MGRKSKKDQRRTQIIEAFFHCVTDLGMARASIRKVADKAGVQPSLLHHYFSGKDEIMEEAVAYFTGRIFDDFRKQLAEPGVNGFERGMAFIFSPGMINDAYTGFFLECCVAARKNPRVRKTLARLFDQFRGAIIEELSAYPGVSALTTEEKEMLSSIIVAIHEGIELQWFADPDRISLDRVLSATRLMIARFIEKGAIPPQ